MPEVGVPSPRVSTSGRDCRTQRILAPTLAPLLVVLQRLPSAVRPGLTVVVRDAPGREDGPRHVRQVAEGRVVRDGPRDAGARVNQRTRYVPITGNWKFNGGFSPGRTDLESYRVLRGRPGGRPLPCLSCRGVWDALRCTSPVSETLYVVSLVFVPDSNRVVPQKSPTNFVQVPPCRHQTRTVCDLQHDTSGTTSVEITVGLLCG